MTETNKKYKFEKHPTFPEQSAYVLNKDNKPIAKASKWNADTWHFFCYLPYFTNYFIKENEIEWVETRGDKE